MRNLLLTIRYIGTNYHGWQMQKNATTVQDAFMPVLYRILGERVDIKGCSRTDTGVHANRFCISFQTNSSIPCDRLVAALNAQLPLDIAAVCCEEKPLDFHARYSVKSKEYVYCIHNSRVRDPFMEGRVMRYPLAVLDENNMHKMAQVLVGLHDFKSFCSIKSDIEDTRRTIYHISVTRSGEMLTVRIKGDGFLYNMVRIIVGTLIKYHDAPDAVEQMERILQGKNRTLAGMTAPACGLYLNRVEYP